MKTCDLKEVTGRWLKGCYKWLVKQDCGCCHVVIGTTAKHNVCVCVGFTDDGTGSQAEGPHYTVAWKIGWQTFDNCMQTDLDIDFDMPANTKAYCDKMNAQLKAKGELNKYNRYVEGDVYDTEETIELKEGKTTPRGYRDWNALAATVRKTARKVLAFARDVDPEE